MTVEHHRGDSVSFRKAPLPDGGRPALTFRGYHVEVAVTELRVEGYRSIRELTLPLGRVNVIVGANGCGKSTLYRAMSLIWHAANGTFSKAIADEGGMASALWAGRFEKRPHIKLGLSLEDCTFDLTCVTPPLPPPSAFENDPLFKEEAILTSSGKRMIPLLSRGPSVCTIRNAEGEKETYRFQLDEQESALSQVSDPHRYPHLTMIRSRLLKLRFYHTFRTDAESPLRRPKVAPRTPILSHDGSDLAAALLTIMHNGNDEGLQEAIGEAFEGASLSVANRGGYIVALESKGMVREFEAPELSDGTLRYLCLLAALMSPRPAPMIALNEPETSLHPDLIEPLARLIHRASEHTQIWITTHSQDLARHIWMLTGAESIPLEKVAGETLLAGTRRSKAGFIVPEESKSRFSWRADE